MTDPDLAEMYWRVRRRPEDGSLAAAIRVHSQACGFVAYAFNTHPDVVARAVAATQQAPAEDGGSHRKEVGQSAPSP